MFTPSFFKKGTNAKCFFRACGSFGELQGDIARDGETLVCETRDYHLSCNYEFDEYGVCTRKDVFKNISSDSLSLRHLKSRFVFEGGEYQVYTQFCHWQEESKGAWQPLSTSVSVGSNCTRTIQDGAPFVALLSEQEQRGVAFHLLPSAAWEIKVYRVGPASRNSQVIVELGFSDYNFDVTLAPGEELSLPQIVCYEFKNKIDFDCYKLHHYLHKTSPRRELPIIYNSWLCCFDQINFDQIAEQIPLAADLGVEYFVIDAGWFGSKPDWTLAIGDWVEAKDYGFRGKMLNIANQVRSHGMKFGLWLEPERAVEGSDAAKNFPQYYIKNGNNYFLDFSNPKARDWMFGIISGLIEHYGIEYIKDDFNENLYFDPNHSAFTEYYAGQKKLINALREKYPNLYLSCCAGGGMRMELNTLTYFDSYWPTDNENPYLGMDIYRQTILRTAPQTFERWVVAHSLQNFEDFYQSFAHYNQGNIERLVASGDATWKYLVGVRPSFYKGYMTGGPIGFSCDLRLLSPAMREFFKEYIKGIKKEREFWKTAVARILCDTPTVTTYQYSDMNLSKIVVQLFTGLTQQDVFCVYPVVNKEKSYRINGEEIRTGASIAEEGIILSTPKGEDNWREIIEIFLEEI